MIPLCVLGLHENSTYLEIQLSVGARWLATINCSYCNMQKLVCSDDVLVFFAWKHTFFCILNRFQAKLTAIYQTLKT